MAAAARDAQVERVAQVLMALRSTPLARIHAAPVVLLSTDAPPVGILGLHVGPNHFSLSHADARLVAIAVRQGPASLDHLAFAAGLEAAANMAELLQLRAELRDLQARLPDFATVTA